MEISDSQLQAAPDIGASELTSSESSPIQEHDARDLVLDIFRGGGTQFSDALPGKPVKFYWGIAEQSDSIGSIVRIRIEFSEAFKPIVWYLFPSQGSLDGEYVYLSIPGMANPLLTIKSVDIGGQKCITSFLGNLQNDVPILVDQLTELFNFPPTDVIFNDHTFNTWSDLLKCPFVYNADNLHIDNALDESVIIQLLDKRVTLDKVTSFTTLVLLDASMLTNTHLSFVSAVSIQIGKNVMSPGEVLTEAQRHLRNETGLTQTFIISIDGWTLENVAEFIEVLGLEKFDWDHKRNFKPPDSISLKICYKSDLWWTNPEETPGGSHHWICHFFKSSSGEIIRFQMDQWEVEQVREPVRPRVTQQSNALPESSDDSDSDQDVVVEEDEYADDNDENNNPIAVVDDYFEELETED